MLRFENMKVAECSFEAWGDELDSKSNWSLFNKHSTFSHIGSCEFILYIGVEEVIVEYEKLGFTVEVTGACRNALKQGYKYLCFYN